MYTKLTDRLKIVNGVLEWGSIGISRRVIFRQTSFLPLYGTPAQKTIE